MTRLKSFLLQRGNQRRNISRFYQVVIYLLPNGFQGGLEIGIPGENKGGGAGLASAHRGYKNEPIGRSSDIQVCEQYVELLMSNDVKGFRDCSSYRDLESMLFQNDRQRLSDSLFVIHEQQAGLIG